MLSFFKILNIFYQMCVCQNTLPTAVYKDVPPHGNNECFLKLKNTHTQRLLANMMVKQYLTVTLFTFPITSYNIFLFCFSVTNNLFMSFNYFFPFSSTLMKLFCFVKSPLKQQQKTIRVHFIGLISILYLKK